MEILFAGVRGSAPRGGPRLSRWGGHSTCVLIAGANGERLLLDAGSGVQLAVEALGPDADELTVLFTHLHLDHVLGFPSLPILYRGDARVTVASALPADELHAALARLVGPPFWPVGLDALPAELDFVRAPAEGADGESAPLQVGALTVRGLSMPHPGGVTAWRVDQPDGAAVVLATDVEWSAASPERRERFVALCRTPHPAGLLAMDGHFPADELADRGGWGHSSPDECLQAAAAAGVDILRVIHHAPEHDDDRLDAMDAAVRRADPRAALAREGETIRLRPEARDRKDAW